MLLNRRGYATVGDVPAVRRHLRLPQLQHLADRAPGAARLARALPLLQPRRAGAQGVPQVRRALPRARRLRHRDGWRSTWRRGFRTARIGRVDRDAVRPQGRADVAPVALRGRRAGHAGGHADDCQGARLPARHAGGRDLRGRRPGDGRFPCRRAHVPAADPGGRPRRPRRAAGRGDRADAVSGALQRAAGVPAGLCRRSSSASWPFARACAIRRSSRW